MGKGVEQAVEGEINGMPSPIFEASVRNGRHELPPLTWQYPESPSKENRKKDRQHGNEYFIGHNQHCGKYSSLVQ